MGERCDSDAPPTAARPPVLATSVVGSYSVPEWLERLKTDFYQRRISGAVPATRSTRSPSRPRSRTRSAPASTSSPTASCAATTTSTTSWRACPGVEIPHLAKTFYYDYYDAYVRNPIPVDDASATLGLVDDLRFTLAYTDRPGQVLVHRPVLAGAARAQRGVLQTRTTWCMAFAQVLNREARALAQAGAAVLQIDEPFLAGYPEEVGLAVKAINLVFDGVDGPTRALHVCYGNRYARPVWEGHYEFLFPAILDAQVDQLVLEFARKGYDDLELFKKYSDPVAHARARRHRRQEPEPEPTELIASRVHQALQVLPPDRLMINPDCGLRHLPADMRAGQAARDERGRRPRPRRESSANRPINPSKREDQP